MIIEDVREYDIVDVKTQAGIIQRDLQIMINNIFEEYDTDDIDVTIISSSIDMENGTEFGVEISVPSLLQYAKVVFNPNSPHESVLEVVDNIRSHYNSMLNFEYDDFEYDDTDDLWIDEVVGEWTGGGDGWVF